MEKQTKVVVDQQSCQEVEGINTYLVEKIEAKDAKIDSLLTDKNEWENQAIKAGEALEKANSGKWWKMVLTWVGTMILTTIVGKAIENSSTQTINKTSSLFPVDEILSFPYEYAAMLWSATRIFVGL